MSQRTSDDEGETIEIEVTVDGGVYRICVNSCAPLHSTIIKHLLAAGETVSRPLLVLYGEDPLDDDDDCDDEPLSFADHGIEDGSRISVRTIRGSHFMLISGGIPAPTVYDPDAKAPRDATYPIAAPAGGGELPLRWLKGCRGISVGNEILIFGGSHDLRDAELGYGYHRYTPGLGWSTGRMPRRRIDFAVANDEVSGLVYLMGGVDATASELVDTYHVASQAWGPAPDMISPRQWCGAAAWQGAIYVAGGYKPTRNTVEVLRPGAEAWESVAPMNSFRGGHGLIATRGKIFALGGYDARHQEDGFKLGCLKSVEEMDLSVGRWEYTTDLPFARDEVIYTYIYIYGTFVCVPP